MTADDRTPGQPEPVSYWPPRPTEPASPAAGYLPVPAQPQSPGPYPPAYGYGPSAYGPLVRPTSGTATASMILGIAGMFLFCLVVPSLVAVLLGHNAIRETRHGHKGGHGQAVAGLILGYVVLIPVAIYAVLMLIGIIVDAFD